MKRNFIPVLLVLFASVSLVFAADVKLKIDGEQSEATKFVQQLNENGSDYGLHFTLVETEYDYRIALDAEGMTTADHFFGGGADAAAAVLNPNCELQFIVSRGGRSTKGGAMNALSKEIDKKLAKKMGLEKK
jgi:hypothetical protein